MVSGAMERRVWTITGDFVTYANLYILLVGSPGTGKGIIREVAALWRETKEPSGGDAFTISADSVTRAALVDDLADAEKIRLTMGQTYIYHSILIPAEEFEVLLPSYNSEFVSLFNTLWNNDPEHEERRRHGPAKVVKIANPFMHLLGGVQPAWFTAHFPEEMWSTGLIRRTIMVYAENPPKRNPFEVTPHRVAMKDHILQRLGQISAIYGAVPWHQEAAALAVEWYENDCAPAPTHSKLTVGYNRTRFEFLVKLSMTSAVSRTGAKGPIEKVDVMRALQWLLQAESKMEDVFRSLQGKSDSSVIEEFHRYVYNKWNMNGKEGIHESDMVKFLMVRVTSDKIKQIISAAERGDLIVRVAGTDKWLPRPGNPIQLH